MKVCFLTVTILIFCFHSGCLRSSREMDSDRLVGADLVSACQSVVEEGKKGGIGMWLGRDEAMQCLPELIRRFNPQYVKVLTAENATVVDIQVSGGFNHKGYLVVCHTGDASFVPRKGANWRIEKVSENIFKYVE